MRIGDIIEYSSRQGCTSRPRNSTGGSLVWLVAVANYWRAEGIVEVGGAFGVMACGDPKWSPMRHHAQGS